MDVLSVLILAVGLAMDAFAVSLCKGTATRDLTIGKIVTVGIWFGVFQALMPIIGFYFGVSFYKYITEIDHWIAFILLSLIGLNMIREALSEDDEKIDDSLDPKVMLVLAVATSIDALAVGISLAMDGSWIFEPALVIGVVTMILSMIGVKVGHALGDRFSKKAELIGGVILILIGLRILIEHMT